MAKEWRFYDSGGVLRKVKEAYFYDSAGARRTVKAGYFYDAQGNRRQFADLGLPPPPAWQYVDYPGADFSMQTADLGGGYFGFGLGSGGAVNPASPVIPTTSYPVENLMLCRRSDTLSGQFELIYDKDQTADPIFSFYAFVLTDANNNPLQVLRRDASSTVGSGGTSAWTWKWPYILPFTVGSVYKFLFKNIVRADTLTTGLVPGGYIGYSWPDGVGSIGQLNVRANTSIYRLMTGGEELILQLRVNSGGDPLKCFIAGMQIDVAGIGFKNVVDASYSYFNEGGVNIAQWVWEETTSLANNTNYNFNIG